MAAVTQTVATRGTLVLREPETTIKGRTLALLSRIAAAQLAPRDQLKAWEDRWLAHLHTDSVVEALFHLFLMGTGFDNEVKTLLDSIMPRDLSIGGFIAKGCTPLLLTKMRESGLLPTKVLDSWERDCLEALGTDAGRDALSLLLVGVLYDAMSRASRSDQTILNGFCQTLKKILSTLLPDGVPVEDFLEVEEAFIDQVDEALDRMATLEAAFNESMAVLHAKGEEAQEEIRGQLERVYAELETLVESRLHLTDEQNRALESLKERVSAALTEQTKVRKEWAETMTALNTTHTRHVAALEAATDNLLFLAGKV